MMTFLRLILIFCMFIRKAYFFIWFSWVNFSKLKEAPPLERDFLVGLQGGIMGENISAIAVGSIILIFAVLIIIRNTSHER